jgi:CHAD domain-containing protein
MDLKVAHELRMQDTQSQLRYVVHIVNKACAISVQDMFDHLKDVQQQLKASLLNDGHRDRSGKLLPFQRKKPSSCI